MPDYFKWLYYASFWQYGLGVLQVNEFANPYTEDCPAATSNCSTTTSRTSSRRRTSLPPRLQRDVQRHRLVVGLWPVKFGGLQNYFLILIGYMLLFIGLAYGVEVVAEGGRRR